MHYISTFADCLVDVNQQSQLCQVFNQKQSTATIVICASLSMTRHGIYDSKCWYQSAKTISRIWHLHLAFCLMTYTIFSLERRRREWSGRNTNFPFFSFPRHLHIKHIKWLCVLISSTSSIVRIVHRLCIILALPIGYTYTHVFNPPDIKSLWGLPRKSKVASRCHS